MLDHEIVPARLAVSFVLAQIQPSYRIVRRNPLPPPTSFRPSPVQLPSSPFPVHSYFRLKCALACCPRQAWLRVRPTTNQNLSPGRHQWLNAHPRPPRILPHVCLFSTPNQNYAISPRRSIVHGASWQKSLLPVTESRVPKKYSTCDVTVGGEERSAVAQFQPEI